MLDQCLRQHRFEFSPPQPTDVGHHFILRLAGHTLVDGEQVLCIRPIRILESVRQTVVRIRLGFLDLGLDEFRAIKEIDSAQIALGALGHLARAVLQGHDPRTSRRDERVRDLEQSGVLAAHFLRLFAAKQVVGPLREVPGQLQVLLLVLSHRDEVRLVEQDVCGHQDRIGEQSRPDLFVVLPRLFLELNHFFQPSHGGDARQQPRHLRVGRDMTLHEHLGLGRVDATGDV